MNMASGDARNWAQPLLRKLLAREPHEFLESWEAFKMAFLCNFTDPVKKEKATRDLGRLMQTKTTQAYAMQF